MARVVSSFSTSFGGAAGSLGAGRPVVRHPVALRLDRFDIY